MIDIAMMIVLGRLFLDSNAINGGVTDDSRTVPHRELMIGERCPQDNTTLPMGTSCVNNRVMPILK